MTPIILYVEDNSDNARLIMKQLREENMLVLVAEDGKTGLEMALTHSPDLILMDFNLPDINGVEAIQYMHRYPELKDIPIIMLTADGSTETQAIASAVNCSDYLVKPVSRNDLLNALSQFIDIGQSNTHIA